jgi:hypothetical protein
MECGYESDASFACISLSGEYCGEGRAGQVSFFEGNDTEELGMCQEAEVESDLSK